MPLHRESYIFHVATEEPATLWSGHGDLLLPSDYVLPAPTIAKGGPGLISIPDIEQVLNGTAQRFEVLVSGISDEALRYALEESLTIGGAEAFIGRVRFDSNWQIAGAIEWEWAGEVAKLGVTGEATETGRQRSLSLTLAHGDTTRSRAAVAFFTDADQRRDYPTDAFFTGVAGINAGTSRRWGPK